MGSAGSTGVITLTTNAQAFGTQIDGLLAEIDRQLDAGYQRWTLKVFYDLVVGTPQWSGDTAANWNYSIGLPSMRYQQIMAKSLLWGKGYTQEQPYQRGALGAVWAAYSRAEDGPMPSWRDKVFFTNNTPIAGSLEDMAVPIRVENLHPDTKAVMMAHFTRDKWSKLPA